MNFYAALLLAYKDVVRQKKLLLIVTIALTLGICNTVLTVGLMKGFEKFVSEDVVQVVAGHVVITPLSDSTKLSNAQSIIDKAEQLSEVEAVFPRNYYTADMRPAGREVKSYLMHGISLVAMDLERERAKGSLFNKIYKGEFLTGEKNEILLGYSLAEDMLGVGVGDKIIVEISSGGQTIMTVAGLVKTGAQGPDMTFAYANQDDLWRITGEKKEYNSIMLKLFDRNKADAVKSALLSEGVQAKVQTWDEMIEYMKQILDMFAVIIGLISGVAIIAGSASVAIMMYINIINRTRQIGTLKAVGASSEFIVATFIVEALLIGLTGVFVGNAVAFLIIQALTIAPLSVLGPSISFVADFNAMLFTSIATLTLVLLASLYPAWRASKLEVIEALRYE